MTNQEVSKQVTEAGAAALMHAFNSGLPGSAATRMAFDVTQNMMLYSGLLAVAAAIDRLTAELRSKELGCAPSPLFNEATE